MSTTYCITISKTHSTTHAISILIEKASHSRANSTNIEGVFFHLHKASDTVDQKLSEINFICYQRKPTLQVSKL